MRNLTGPYLALIIVFVTTSAFATEEERPEDYPIELPIAKRFCVPVRTAFAESSRSETIVRGRRVQHPRNGGFGKLVDEPGTTEQLVHTGADIGWMLTREPVFAIADGIVRHSSGPSLNAKRESTKPPTQLKPWGNLVVIEHRLDESTFATSIYGHLGGDRRVKLGQRVEAGQPIGTIGRKHLRINGGYDPHLHFGIRKGRNAEGGAVLLNRSNGWLGPRVILAGIDSQQVELQCAKPIYLRWRMMKGGRHWDLKFVEGRAVAPASMFWDWQRPGFEIEGYAASTDGWYDPIQFLRERNAVSNPARLRKR